MTGNTQTQTAATPANLSDLATEAENVDGENPRAVLGFLTKVARDAPRVAPDGHAELATNAAERGVNDIDEILSDPDADRREATFLSQFALKKVTRRLKNGRDAEWFEG